ncbi:MAG: inositol monophosphatase [Proteobacteria bacterium]|nr:inositol monophosphatase [Pseudomonadota bacterium]
MHPLVNIAIQAVRQASKIILRNMDRLDTLKVSQKAHNDFVTEVDKRSEQEIIQVIRKAYPEHGILGEESGYEEGGDYCWVIDPLDGTTNYIHGFPHFSISIAVKHKDVLEAGVIYDPVRNELFAAARGKGATCNDKRIRVSSVKKLSEALIGTGFPHREIEHVAPFIKTLTAILPLSAGIRRAGSAALDLAYVAAGRLDGFWEAYLKEWDMAAGALIIQEAGGVVTGFTGKTDHLQTGNVVTANSKIHQALLDVLKPNTGMI